MDDAQMWYCVIYIPDGPATSERTARIALTACGFRDAPLEAEQAEVGAWLVGFPPSVTVGWEEKENDVVWLRSPHDKFRIEVPFP